MSKHNLMKKIASVATELDYAGFTKEAKNMDIILLKLASGPEDENYGDPNLNSDMSDKDYFDWLEGIAEEMENYEKNPYSESSDNWGDPQQDYGDGW